MILASLSLFFCLGASTAFCLGAVSTLVACFEFKFLISDFGSTTYFFGSCLELSDFLCSTLTFSDFFYSTLVVSDFLCSILDYSGFFSTLEFSVFFDSPLAELGFT